jgi:Uma2 family endonuclease
MASPARASDHALTYRDYLLWDGDARHELIEGVAYSMALDPGVSHQSVVGELFYQLRAQLEGHPCRPFVAPIDVRLPRDGQSDDESDTVVQPDVFVVCDPGKLDARGVLGAPDFIVEVLSPATAARDQIEKRKVYERAGVREYWLVHPTDRVLTLYRSEGERYSPAQVVELALETPVLALPGVIIRWDPVVKALGLRAE